MLKVAKNHEKKAKMGRNGVFGKFVDVLLFLCSKTDIFATGSVKNQGDSPPFRQKSKDFPSKLLLMREMRFTNLSNLEGFSF
jgi:hypothetical protein